METTQSISENPSFSFAFKATEPGILKVTFLDTHGGTYESTAEIKFS
jgi:Sulphur oxidation protein SoxZ